VLLDGQAQVALQEDTSVTLENVDRGSHTVQGQIIDVRGDVLMSSETISVHMHRQSVLAPNRAQPTPKPNQNRALRTIIERRLSIPGAVVSCWSAHSGRLPCCISLF